MRPWVPLLALALLVPTSVVLRSESMTRYLDAQRYEDITYLPPPAVLEAVSFGYGEALADLVWVRAQVYVGEQFQHQGGSTNVFRYARAIERLDPDFVRLYRWIGVTGIYRTRDSTLDEVQETVAMMRRGAERFPDDGDLLFELGSTMVYDLAPRIEDPEEQERIKREGNELLSEAALRGAGPAWLVFSNASRYEQLGATELAIRHLEEMYAIADEEMQQHILLRLRDLREEADVERLRSLVEDLEESRREHYPYVPATLFLLVGEPPDHEGALLDWFLPAR